MVRNWFLGRVIDICTCCHKDTAVTVGMVLIGAITIARGALLFDTQLLESIVAAALVSAPLSIRRRRWSRV